jgi:hypothetical protein
VASEFSSRFDKKPARQQLLQRLCSRSRWSMWLRNSNSAQLLNRRTCIVDLLKLLNIDTSLAARKVLAAELDCPLSLMANSAQMNGCAAERNPGVRAAGSGQRCALCPPRGFAPQGRGWPRPGSWVDRFRLSDGRR